MENKTLKNQYENNGQEFNSRRELLDNLENNNIKTDHIITLDYTKFKYLCQFNETEDIADVHINYIPDKYLIEVQSLRTYLRSFENSEGIKEDITNTILNDLIGIISPNYLEILVNGQPKNRLTMNSYVNYGKIDSKYEKIALKRFELNIFEDL